MTLKGPCLIHSLVALHDRVYMSHASSDVPALVFRRALGLTLLEAATGRYPYDASGGPLELMLQVSTLPLLDSDNTLSHCRLTMHWPCAEVPMHVAHMD